MSELTYEEALEQLTSLPDVQINFDFLEKLIKKISVNDVRENTNLDAIMYLYSGRGTKDTYVMPERFNPEVKIIQNTHLGRFISSDSYKNAIVRIYVNEGMIADDAKLAANAYIRGTGTSGPWVEASRRFVEEAQCAVKVFLNDPGRDRVWWQVEMPAAMENDKITTINGIPQRQLAGIYHHCIEGRQLDMVCELTAIVPAENVDSGYLDRAVLHYDRNGKIVTIDPSAINGIAPEISETAVFAVTIGEVKSGVPNVKMSVRRPGDDFVAAPDKQHRAARGHEPRAASGHWNEPPIEQAGPGPEKGRMSMAGWKAQIAEMKAKEQALPRHPSVKQKDNSHVR